MKQDGLFSSDNTLQSQKAGPVTCLGKIFTNDQERREYFLALLAEKLKDPEFRKIEGFPIGSDEAILNLSDPPYYTACPNPWIGNFIAEWEAQKSASEQEYHREPFAADVSEGKNDPIYNAHSYHTKVPHKAIMRYLLHYTNPGDIVFDGFSGTGMTGVAAQMCGDREAVMSLGFQVQPDGTILQEEIDGLGKTAWRPFSKLGVRRAILNDLSPAATFISYNYNTPVSPYLFEKESNRILKAVQDECGWMYETRHSDGRIGKINYTVWSDVFICTECAGEIVFWDEAVDSKNGKVRDEFPCPHCAASLSKRTMERAWIKIFDPALKESIAQAKQVPVQINYSVPGMTGRCEKKPDLQDYDLIDRINNDPVPYWFPSDKVPEGDKTSDPFRVGVTHAHHFYSKRNLRVLSTLRHHLNKSPMESQLLCLVGDQLPRASKMHKIAVSRLNTNLSKTAGVLAGTLYIPSNQIEYNINSMIGFRIKDVVSYLNKRDQNTRQIVLTGSTEATRIPGESLDYFFFDPPFGSNLMYSELNFLWETWLGVRTNKTPEAIENRTQKKKLDDYRVLMTRCFSEAYRILKPGRWMTVEFSNTKASVWNSIQTSITEAGFIVANVSALDKKQGTFNAVTNTTSVKQDLVITAYKPNEGFEKRFRDEAQSEEGVWDFASTHLKYLPVTKQYGTLLQFVPERDPRILFDQMVAFFVRKGYPVPISSQEFQIGLSQRFIERDGMYFLSEQVSEYDRKKMASSELKQLDMFVSDEASAIQWLRQLIKDKPQTFSDINPQFMQQLGGWSKNEIVLDLRELLSQNFLCYDGQDKVPDQIHSYLSSNWKELRNLAKNDPALVAKAKDRWYLPDPNKAGDLEKLREKSLLKEFEEYKDAKKKLKVFRIEAVRVGFKKLWELQDFAVLIAVADKLPSNVLEEDPVLLMYYDQAVTLSQVDTDDEW
ncbi:DNA methyltransferase [Pantoea agglomerans]|uniref:DNA methyltransferase n=1 Tax=Enterobacter agglomerans TaxID=549 RepID=UPI0017829643|nr:DNA methyltransferase [Pantoea agglomerans]WVL85255.1 DNA methyltransferase [Pantoea agglomerans]